MFTNVQIVYAGVFDDRRSRPVFTLDLCGPVSIQYGNDLYRAMSFCQNVSNSLIKEDFIT